MLRKKKTLPCWAIYDDGSWQFVANITLYKWRIFGKQWINKTPIHFTAVQTGILVRFVFIDDKDYIPVPITKMRFS